MAALAIELAFVPQSGQAQTETPASDPCRRALSFVVRDASTRQPIAEVALRLTRDGERDSPRGSHQLDPWSRTLFSDAQGQVRFDRLCPGAYTVETTHVGYLTNRTDLRLAPIDPRENERARIMELDLVPRVYSVDEVDVRAETVAPLVSLERSSRVVPSATALSFVTYDLVDAIGLVPGVLVSGDRLFFRGVAAEHVATTIDGVPARQPITGRWILPPPEAVAGAELIASTVVAESAPSLGGLLALRLLDGTGRRTTRLVYGTNAGWGNSDRRTDAFTAMSAGPTTLSGLSYAGAYRGIMQSTSVSYDRALPGQSIFGIGTLGRRMNGDEAASFKLSWDGTGQSGSGWRANAAVISTRSRGKTFQANYARSGWVGYNAELDRYTHFLEEPPNPGRDRFYEGPEHVPIEEDRSTLLYTTFGRDFGEERRIRGHLFHGNHEIDTEHAGRELESEEAIEAWESEALTETSHQEEQFYALHGDLPVYTRGRSRELGGGVSSGWKLADHELGGGFRIQGGRHRYLSVLPPPVWWIGSWDEPLVTWDGSGFLQDTWRTDSRSWLQLALRYDFRDVRWEDRSTFAARWSPVIAFHQPMTAADALHVEAGQSYQFPALQSHFPARLAGPGDPPLQAQRVRFAEVGIQHHFSKRAIAYLGARDRQYTDVVFAARTPTDLEELTGARRAPSGAIEQRELELSLDLQLSAALTGQTSLVWSRTTAETVAGDETTEVPWSRRGYLRSWLLWRGASGLSSTIAFSWDSGRPYDLCLISRGCAEWQRIRGRLPAPSHTDWAATWRTDLVGAPLELSLQVENLFDQRPPSYDFSVFPMGVTADQFLAYWDATGETDGYLRDTGLDRIEREVDNPQARALGRSVVFAIGVRL